MLLYYREIYKISASKGIDATTDVANIQLVLIAAG
jgi:hypothetical protein